MVTRSSEVAIDEVFETHVSWVTLIGDRAYKRKKPVRTGFLDFTTLDARHHACLEEVRVNRRLAPDVYLGVDPVLGKGGEVVDYVVVMRRMPAEARLSTLVESGADVADALRQVARHVAALHLKGGQSSAADQAGSARATLARWEANHAEFAPMAPLLADRGRPDRVMALARRYVAGRGHLFAHRVRSGRCVDGHGDLLADDIFVLGDGPRILDAIEFDAGLRLGDGLADIAFLAMDLERLGAPSLAGQVLRWYAEFAADRWPASLAHFQIAYRAQVRAKVACLRARQEGSSSAPAADHLLRLAESHLRAGRCVMVLVGGPPATGKTTVAADLASRHDWPVLRSDELRKELTGHTAYSPADAPLGGGVYSATMTKLTYGELLHRAGALLGDGESVILDATWGDARWRAEARDVARRLSVDLVEVRCSLPAPEAAARARGRMGSGDASDAGPEIATALSECFAAWPEALVLGTGDAPGRVTERADQLVAACLAA